MKKLKKYDSIVKSIAKVDNDAATNADIILSNMQDRERRMAEMRKKINKEFNSVSGKPKRNLPV